MGKRTIAVYMVMVLLFTGMICRMYVLTTGDTLASVARTQSAFELNIDTTRGIVYDCNLKPLVNTEKRTVAAIQPSPEAFTAVTEAVRKYGEQITLDAKSTKPFLVTLRHSQIYSKGVELFDIQNRYAKNQLAPHIIGYLNPEKTNGTAGIELAFDKELAQYSGSLKLRYSIDAMGRTMAAEPPEINKEDTYRSAGGVALTLDAQFQRGVQNAMRNVKKGAAVVMDITTGDIKASASMPAYDPNNLAASLQNPDSPFVNRAFSQYSVGSTFKLVTAAAALESGYGRYTPYTCTGFSDVDGHVFYCHWRNGHGSIDLQKAIEVSCNPFFIHMGQVASGKRIASMAREIGFTRAAQFAPDIGTQSGTLPADNDLNAATAVANLSFGQGRLTATPVQIAQMLSTVANGGYAVTPRLVEGFTTDGKAFSAHTTSYTPSRVFSKSTSDILRESLVNNVLNGSGKLAKPNYCTAGGKTASAQTGIYTIPGNEDSEIVHAWFAGYFPAENPRYAIAVVVEEGKSGGDAAAPIFQKIADAITIATL